MRVGAREAIDTVEQPAAREGADDANGQHLAQMTPGIKIERRPDPLKSVRHQGHKSLPLVRQGKAARQAAEQSRSQTAFQGRPLLATRALTDAQYHGVAREVEITGARFDRP